MHAECIAEQHQEQELCARTVKKNFETKVKATTNVDVMMTSTCRYAFREYRTNLDHSRRTEGQLMSSV